MIRTWPTAAPLTVAIVAVNLVIHIGVSLGGEFAVDALWEIGAQRSDGPWYEGWRWFTCAWIHGDYSHVLINCAYLLVAGRLLEPTIGSGRFAFIYLISIIGGSIGEVLETMLNSTSTLGAGASGAIAGIMGALLAVPCCVRLGRALLVWAFVAHEVGMLVAYGPEPGIGFGAHAGGLIAGFVAGTLCGGAGTGDEESDNAPLLDLLLLAPLASFQKFAGRREEPSGLLVARGRAGKLAPTSTSEVADRNAIDPAAAEDQGPRRVAVISVWPEESGTEIR